VQRFAVKLYSSLAPRTEILVAGFLDRRDRSKWLCKELPPKLKALADTLGLDEISFRLKRCEISVDMLGQHILPDDVIHTIRQQHQDRHATD